MPIITETVTGMDAILAAAAPNHLLSAPLRAFHSRVDIIIQSRARANAARYNDRGGLAGSITYQIDPEPIPLFSVVGSNLPYAPAAEFGRPPGSFPPIDAIQGWVHRKGLVSGVFATARSANGTHRLIRRKTGANIAKMERQVSFLIARKIFLHGSPARPYLRKAFAESKGDIQAEVGKLAQAIGQQWGKP